ncbi:hypothetical protein [Pedobacter frigoris]|uniref:hypothetical protein n=1 Tax=Pedobacter frigoris TaxID=2571272 RepID=UPI002931BF5F|nr:hypothetical protein [Pedobacter frigoris]
MKILITGGKSVQALKLVDRFAGDTVILADYGEAPSFPSTKYFFISLGERNDDVIAHNLLNHCLNEAVDAILPLNAFEKEEVLKSSVLFKEFNIDVLTPDL